MANQGDRPPRFRRGQRPSAADLNALSRSVPERISGGPGATIQSANGQILVAAPTIERSKVPDQMFVQIVADLGGGDYSWKKYKGAGPDTGDASTTPSRVAKEVTGATGVAVDTKVLIFRIGGSWWFVKAASGGGKPMLLGYPAATSGGGWGSFQVPGTGMLATMGVAKEQWQGAAINGRPASASAANGNFPGISGGITTGGTLPDPNMYVEWVGIDGIPESFAVVGPNGIRMRQRFVFIPGTGTGVGTNTFNIRMGVFRPTVVNDPAHVFVPADFFPSPWNFVNAFACGTPYAGGPACYVDRVLVNASDPTSMVTMQLTKAQLDLVGFQPGDQVVVYVAIVRTTGPVGVIFPNVPPKWQFVAGGIELDGTG